MKSLLWLLREIVGENTTGECETVFCAIGVNCQIVPYLNENCMSLSGMSSGLHGQTSATAHPRTREQKKSSANSRRVTRGETRGSQRQSLGEELERICPGQVERDHQHEPAGKLSQSEAENFRDEANQSKIETVWFG